MIVMKEDLKNYLDYLLYQRGYSKYTIKNYQEDITEFIDYCDMMYLTSRICSCLVFTIPA